MLGDLLSGSHLVILLVPLVVIVVAVVLAVALVRHGRSSRDERIAQRTAQLMREQHPSA